jgi:hypothetical protein
MPLKSDTRDILGYYDESWFQPNHDHAGRTFADALARAIDTWQTPHERWPVRNREDRTPISSQKRAIIHERDGGTCRLCGIAGVQLTVDHIIPRSAFPADQLHIADRSDNLMSACWPCNQDKSNYERSQRKRLGVVPACWYCVTPALDEYEQLPYPVTVLVFCGHCGISNVPAVAGWVL